MCICAIKDLVNIVTWQEMKEEGKRNGVRFRIKKPTALSLEEVTATVTAMTKREGGLRPVR
jgi:hypothetical protein